MGGIDTRERGGTVYNGAGLVGLAGGVTLGGVAFAAMGAQGGGVVGVVGALVTVLLGYRAWRVRRATSLESG